MDLTGFLLITPPILFSLTIHEYAHAWSANRLGDPTAKELGRLTLNPLAHIDFLGILMLYLVHLGWAKPVPVNPYNLKNPRRDMMWVAAAGPISNIILAFILGLFIRSLSHSGLSFDPNSFSGILIYMLVFGFLINLVLAFFNLLPIPPLDGSKILRGFLPARYEIYMIYFERLGPFLILFIFLFGQLLHLSFLWAWLRPLVGIFSYLFAGTDLTQVL
ncbi:MAG: hypothetical protein A2145_01760 [candidate division Zixibacteria bacterium RBG_16_40_9]|nr:MAG: hypothetical protein A2145_01760 [candidate division Zixibacteria bacterium RBG_16_40_9]